MLLLDGYFRDVFHWFTFGFDRFHLSTNKLILKTKKPCILMLFFQFAGRASIASKMHAPSYYIRSVK
jgi:hypothetical protein